MNVYERIGAKIRALREDYGVNGISQAALARAIETTPNTISRWETAKYKPSIEDLDKLARFFGISITIFFPPVEPRRGIKALLSAAQDLDDEDLDDLVRYSHFRRNRKTSSRQKEALDKSLYDPPMKH